MTAKTYSVEDVVIHINGEKIIPPPSESCTLEQMKRDPIAYCGSIQMRIKHRIPFPYNKIKYFNKRFAQMCAMTNATTMGRDRKDTLNLKQFKRRGR